MDTLELEYHSIVISLNCECNYIVFSIMNFVNFFLYCYHYLFLWGYDNNGNGNKNKDVKKCNFLIISLQKTTIVIITIRHNFQKQLDWTLLIHQSNYIVSLQVWIQTPSVGTKLMNWIWFFSTTIMRLREWTFYI